MPLTSPIGFTSIHQNLYSVCGSVIELEKREGWNIDAAGAEEDKGTVGKIGSEETESAVGYRESRHRCLKARNEGYAGFLGVFTKGPG